MEYGLRADRNGLCMDRDYRVLILLLMEYGLRATRDSWVNMSMLS